MGDPLSRNTNGRAGDAPRRPKIAQCKPSNSVSRTWRHRRRPNVALQIHGRAWTGCAQGRDRLGTNLWDAWRAGRVRRAPNGVYLPLDERTNRGRLSPDRLLLRCGARLARAGSSKRNVRRERPVQASLAAHSVCVSEVWRHSHCETCRSRTFHALGALLIRSDAEWVRWLNPSFDGSLSNWPTSSPPSRRVATCSRHSVTNAWTRGRWPERLALTPISICPRPPGATTYGRSISRYRGTDITVHKKQMATALELVGSARVV